MNATVYPEPYRLPAGILALLVHGVFFALLYFGFSWQTQPAATMSVELWQSLPDTAAPAKPKVEEAAPPVEPQKLLEPDIALPDKEKLEIKPLVAQPPEKKKTDAKPVQKSSPSSADQQAALEQAEQAAATGRVVDEYTGKIQGQIRRKIVKRPGVPTDVYAQFMVTVLPGGSVLTPRLLKSSGYPAFDDAVERAILKAQPLPLPPDAALFNRFRELRLTFRPEE